MFKGLEGRRRNLRPGPLAFKRSISTVAQIAGYSRILKPSGLLRAFADVMTIHHHIIKSGLEQNALLGNLLVQMHGSVGSLHDARVSFEILRVKDRYSWNFVIVACVRHGQGQAALDYFGEMQEKGAVADKFIVSSVLSACTALGSVSKGMLVHAYVIAYGIEMDPVIGGALVFMYGKCGVFKEAQSLLNEMHEKDVLSCNSMLAAYAQHGRVEAAFQVFNQMQCEAVSPNKVTYVSLISAIANGTCVAQAKLVHARTTSGKFEIDVVVGTALVNMYSRCGSLPQVHNTFQDVIERNSFLWSSIVAVYAELGEGKQSLQFFDTMLQEGIVPNSFTYLSIISTCAKQGLLLIGKHMHVYVSGNKLGSDVKIGNALINMYGKCARLKDAESVFRGLPARDVVSWTSLISVCVQNGALKDVLQVFYQMLFEGEIPNKATFISLLSSITCKESLAEGRMMHLYLEKMDYNDDAILLNVLMSMYARCGSVQDVWNLFKRSAEPNVYVWCAMITALVNDGDSRSAFFLFSEIQKHGVLPDKAILIGMLSGSVNLVTLVEGKRLHGRISGCDFKSEVDIVNALVNMYGKCGSLTEACSAFDDFASHDLITWNSMIAVYAQHGYTEKAFLLFDEMRREGIAPDRITFLNLLYACNHAGLVGDGCRSLLTMAHVYGMNPLVDHYNCIIDLLGRAGLLDEAEKLLKHMPTEATAVSWMALLSACRDQLDMERGKSAAKHVFDKDSEKAAAYVTLSNIYALSIDGGSCHVAC